MNQIVCDPISFGQAPRVPPVQLRDALGEINTDITVEQMEARTRALLCLNLPSLSALGDLYYGQDCIVVGSGMSLDVEYVRERQAAGARVFVVNKSHDHLIERGIIPDFSVMLDPNARVAGYQTPNRRVTYILGSTCDRGVWERFLGFGIKPFLFAPAMRSDHPDRLAKLFPGHDICAIGGVTTAGLRTINIAGWMGFMEPELHAFDSCYAPGKNGRDKTGLYGVDKPTTYHDSREDTVISGTGAKLTFITNGAMARQVLGFASILASLPDQEHQGRVGALRLRVSGDGVIPWMAWKDSAVNGWVRHTHPERMAAKYGDAKHWDYFKGEPRND